MAKRRTKHTLFTVGHSTRSLDEFVTLLQAHDIGAVADVRLIPKSRRYPHFNDEALAKSLPKAGIDYLPFRSLGGRRRPAKDSANTGWRNESFRGYADYLGTEPFRDALDELLTVASKIPTVIMCAEAVPWRCHRSLIADAALVRGWHVFDVMTPTSAPPHRLTKFARVDGQRLTYPAETEATLFHPSPPAPAREG